MEEKKDRRQMDDDGDGCLRKIEKASKTLELINALNEIYLFTRRFLGYEYFISCSLRVAQKDGETERKG